MKASKIMPEIAKLNFPEPFSDTYPSTTSQDQRLLDICRPMKKCVMSVTP